MKLGIGGRPSLLNSMKLFTLPFLSLTLGFELSFCHSLSFITNLYSILAYENSLAFRQTPWGSRSSLKDGFQSVKVPATATLDA